MAESEVECFRGVAEVICTQRHTTSCMSRHNSRWMLDLSPKNPINVRALSLGPRLSLFSGVSYCPFKWTCGEMLVISCARFWVCETNRSVSLFNQNLSSMTFYCAFFFSSISLNESLNYSWIIASSQGNGMVHNSQLLITRSFFLVGNCYTSLCLCRILPK